MKMYCVLALVLVGTCALVQGQLGGGMNAGMVGVGSNNPMTAFLMWQMLMNDPKVKHMPIMHMLMLNPALMYNPMGAFMLANVLGVDLHKIATPMAMVNPNVGMLRWMPLMMGDPNMLSLLYSFSGGFGSGAGGAGGMAGAMG